MIDRSLERNLPVVFPGMSDIEDILDHILKKGFKHSVYMEHRDGNFYYGGYSSLYAAYAQEYALDDRLIYHVMMNDLTVPYSSLIHVLFHHWFFHGLYENACQYVSRKFNPHVINLLLLKNEW